MASDLDEKYFDNENVFILSGHSGNHPRDESYELKPHEFYASPARCGYLLYTSTSQFHEILNSDPKIKIPTPSSKTYYTLNYEHFPFKSTQSLHEEKENVSTNFEWESNAFKMYVPFSTKQKTKTIPNNKYVPFNYLITKNVIIPDTIRYITVKNQEYDKTRLGNYFSFYLGISGLLNPNVDSRSKYAFTKKFLHDLPILEQESIKLLRNCGFSKEDIPIRGVMELFLLIPEYAFDKDIMDDYSSDPLLDYCKKAIETMFLLSTINLSQIIDANGTTLTFKNILNYHIYISHVFDLLNEHMYGHLTTNNTKEPMLLINPLCRNYKLNNTNTSSNNIRRRNIINQSNIRSISKSGNTKRYRNFRNKTRKLIKNRINMNNIVNKLYGPVSKKVINVPMFSNVTGLKKNFIQNYLNEFNENNIISPNLNTNSESVETSSIGEIEEINEANGNNFNSKKVLKTLTNTNNTNSITQKILKSFGLV